MEAKVGTIIGMDFKHASEELMKLNPGVVPVRYTPDQEDIFATEVMQPNRVRLLVDRNNFVVRSMMG